LFLKNNKDIKGSSISAGFDLEFIFLAQKYGYKIKEVPVIWKHVETKNVNFLNDSIETLKDILKIKYYTKTNPSRTAIIIWIIFIYSIKFPE